MTTDLLSLADERFVSLTTLRRTGEPVATPVWIARHGDALVVTTSPRTGKVARVRRDPRVTLRPCNRAGGVDGGAPTVAATAEVVTDAAAVEGPMSALRTKYRSEWWAVQAILLVERILRCGPGERVILRLTPVA